MRTSWRSAVLVAALSTSLTAGQDALSQLGITPDAARHAVGAVVTAGIHNPGLPTAAFKLLPPAARAQAVSAGVAWVKTYVASPDFSRQYLDVREHHKPQAPAWETTPEQELQKADDDERAQLEESKQAIASLPPEQRKSVEDGLKAAAEKTAKANTPEMRKTRLDAIKAKRAELTNEYDAALARWKQEYPDDPKPVVVKRLRQFLQLSADVDFNAQVKTTDGASVFANPAYQAKSSQWKMCFRAGREATAAARAAVQAWLTELGG
jgi:hypothetical protein